MTSKPTRSDYFPNYMSWKITQTAADAYTTDKIYTPIPRNQIITGNKAIVMELLWLECDPHNMHFNNELEEVFWALTTGSPDISMNPTGFISNGGCIAYGSACMHMLTSGASISRKPYITNLQSADGHGILLATDSFNVLVDTLNSGYTNIFYFRLYYRFVQINTMEFIGLIQSQQTS